MVEGFRPCDMQHTTDLHLIGVVDSNSLRWEAILRYERILLDVSEYPDARRFATDLFLAHRRGIVAWRSETATREAGP